MMASPATSPKVRCRSTSVWVTQPTCKRWRCSGRPEQSRRFQGQFRSTARYRLLSTRIDLRVPPAPMTTFCCTCNNRLSAGWHFPNEELWNIPARASAFQSRDLPHAIEQEGLGAIERDEVRAENVGGIDRGDRRPVDQIGRGVNLVFFTDDGIPRQIETNGGQISRRDAHQQRQAAGEQSVRRYGRPDGKVKVGVVQIVHCQVPVTVEQREGGVRAKHHLPRASWRD